MAAPGLPNTATPPIEQLGSSPDPQSCCPQPFAKDTSDVCDALVKTVTDSISLASLGWTDFFGDQLEPDEKILVPTRIASVHRDRLAGLSQTGPADLTLPANANTGDYAVGDWVLSLIHISEPTRPY